MSKNSMLRAGKFLTINLLGKNLYRLFNGRGQMKILFYETRGEFFKQAKHVIGHQHLAVTFQSGTNAYGGNGHSLCNNS